MSPEDQRAIADWQLRTRVALGAILGGLVPIAAHLCFTWMFTFPNGANEGNSGTISLLVGIIFMFGVVLHPLVQMADLLWSLLTLPWAPLFAIGVDLQLASLLGGVVNFAIFGGLLAYLKRASHLP